MTKSIFSSRTFWFNVLGFLASVLALPDFLNLIPLSALPYLILGQSLINILLRYVTTQPVSL